MAAKIRKGDQVVVLSGRDHGRKGEVLSVRPREDRVIVRGVNEVKRHRKPSQQDPGGIVTIEAPIAISNVAHIDPKDGRPTRVGFRVAEDGRKIRYAKRSGAPIEV